jgi:peptide/nickel transport system substrate-binding protein
MAVALLAACANEAAPVTSDGPADGQIDREAEMVFIHTLLPSSFDPHRATSDNDMLYLRPAYDSLIDVTSNGEPTPMLATSWELTSDTFTLNLRADATFSDGTPVNAEAVKVNIDRLLTGEGLVAGREIKTMVESVEVAGEHQVVLKLKGPGGSLPLQLAGRAGMLISPKAIDNEDLDQKPVGAGAMVMTASNPGSSYTFKRRDDYWDDEAYRYQTLRIEYSTDKQQALAALLSGQASFITGNTGDLMKEAESLGLRVVRPSVTPVDHFRLALNTNRGPLGIREVRQAISAAIDREGINNGPYGGACPGRVNPFPEGYVGHGNPNNSSDWEYNPERAKALLAAAGFPNGFDFELGIATVASQQALGQVLQENLKAVGINASLVQMDSVQLRARFASGDLDSHLGLLLGPTDPSGYYNDNLAPGSAVNPGGLDSPRLRELAAATQESADPAERAKAFAPFMEEVFRVGPQQIVICGYERASITRQDVAGETFLMTGGQTFRSMYTLKK